MLKSVTTATRAIQNIEQATRELAPANTVFEAGRAVGLLFCSADADGAALSAALHSQLKIPIAGMTSQSLLTRSGRQEKSAILTIISSDDCSFGVGVSAPLDADGGAHHRANIAAAYTASARMAAESPKLMFAFCPANMPFSGDKYSQILTELSGAAPVIGGVASDEYDFTHCKTFLSGQAYQNALVLVSLFGDIRPVFSMQHVTSRFAPRLRRITDARDNVVHRVGDETFTEYLASFGLDAASRNPLVDLVSHPMMLTTEGTGEASVMRHIAALDPANGTGTFLGDVLPGTLANICRLDSQDVKDSCRDSAQALLQKIENAHQENYTYSLVFCVSCCGRATILGEEIDEEGATLSALVPAQLSLSGIYCLGELGPARYYNGNAANKFHNCSITLCAI